VRRTRRSLAVLSARVPRSQVQSSAAPPVARAWERCVQTLCAKGSRRIYRGSRWRACGVQTPMHSSTPSLASRLTDRYVPRNRRDVQKATRSATGSRCAARRTCPVRSHALKGASVLQRAASFAGKVGAGARAVSEDNHINSKAAHRVPRWCHSSPSAARSQTRALGRLKLGAHQLKKLKT